MARRKNNNSNLGGEMVIPDNKPLSKYGKEYGEVMAAQEVFDEAIASCRSTTPSTNMRQNVATSINPIAKYAPIYESSCSPYPFGYGDAGSPYAGGYGNNPNGYGWGYWAPQAITLLQCAYTCIPKLRQTIDLQVKFCVGNLVLRGGTVQSRRFFEKWLKKINIRNLQSQFYLEYNRSGSCYFYKLNSTLTKNTIREFNEAFGSALTPGKKMPIKYLLLNPAWIALYGAGANFVCPTYYKVLNQYELSALFNNQTPENLSMLEKIPELKQIVEKYKGKGCPNFGAIGIVKLPLAPENLAVVYNFKTDYESVAVPRYFGCIELFAQLIELRRIDLAINRQILRATLLITAGDSEVGAPSSKQIAAIQSLFTSDSVSNVIVGDYTIKGEWLVPNVGELFNPNKYTQLNKEIEESLGNVLLGDSKFSGVSAKLDVFVEQLNYDRQVFLDQFLIPEMEELAREFGFKDIPTPEYEPIKIGEEATKIRVYTQMAQLGLLTAEELMIALKTDVLPDFKESIANQEEYKDLRAKGLYQPLIGGAKEGPNPGGRPAGATSPQTTKNIKPAGNVGASLKASPESLKDTVIAATKLEKVIEAAVKEKYKYKKLNKQQMELVGGLVEQIVLNEEKQNWENSVEKYLDFKNKIDNSEVYAKIDRLASNLELDNYSAAILHHSLFEIEENNK